MNTTDDHLSVNKNHFVVVDFHKISLVVKTLGDKTLRYRGRWKCPQSNSLPSEGRFVGSAFPSLVEALDRGIFLKGCSTTFQDKPESILDRLLGSWSLPIVLQTVEISLRSEKEILFCQQQ